MALAHCSSHLAVSYNPSLPLLDRPPRSNNNNLSFSLRSLRKRDPVLSSAFRRTLHRATAEVHESGGAAAVDVLTNVKHLLLPITDRNPYLSEGTRQAAANTTSLAKKYGADITVVVIDDNPKESNPEHDTLLSNIRWHLSEGGFQEFGLMERLGEGKKPTAIIDAWRGLGAFTVADLPNSYYFIRCESEEMQKVFSGMDPSQWPDVYFNSLLGRNRSNRHLKNSPWLLFGSRYFISPWSFGGKTS